MSLKNQANGPVVNTLRTIYKNSKSQAEMVRSSLALTN
jgi:hypothetical protein